MPTAKRSIQSKSTPKGTSRTTAADRRRQAAILLERGTMTAGACAARHGVSHWTVRSIWSGRRGRMPGPSARVLVMIQEGQDRWRPATRADEDLVRELVCSAADWRTPISGLLHQAAAHGVAVVFRGDVSPPLPARGRGRAK